jgi:hypothetical protein
MAIARLGGITFVTLLVTVSALAGPCVTVGQTPLDAGPGLYGPGLVTRPSGHTSAGIAASAQINGPVGLLTIGMSNTRNVADRILVRQTGTQPGYTFVHAAQGGVTVWRWADPADVAWDVVSQRIADAELTDADIQAAWVFNATGGNQSQASQVAAHLDVLDILRNTFPRLRVVYMTSVHYAGCKRWPNGQYAEPRFYNQGFVMREIVEQYIAGALPTRPWVDHAYFWRDADGAPDGLKLSKKDFYSDGLHPNIKGSNKLADWIINRWFTDPVTWGWMY